MDKIDFVITWVDGNDKMWQEERNKYNSEKNDNRNIRYRDWNNLKYWFRAIEKYAPWVNKIYFVTWGHIPSWLNTENEKLVIVRHEDFIPKEYLPTFNSNAIELNLHRIKGLSEQFVYFNDDMFLVNNVKETDFFRNGLPCDSAILSPAIKENKYGIGNIELNNMAIINTYFYKKEQMKKKLSNWFNIKYEFGQNLKNILLLPWHDFTSFFEFHISSVFLKSTFEEIWNKEYDELNETCKHKFRDLKLDLNQWLMRDWQLASNKFIPRKTNYGKLCDILPNVDLKKEINDAKCKEICLNDTDNLTEEEFNRLSKTITEAFEEKLPEKSTFEI